MIYRVYPDGRGSYNDVIKNVPLWLSQFPNATTKATFSHDDLPYLKDSIVHLWNIGIKKIPANIVYEDVWEKGDDKIFEEQLKLLADYVIEKETFLDPEYTVQFFNRNIGYPINKSDKKHKYCGSGKMLAVDCEGNFFPCIRFTDFSMSKKKCGWKIGDIGVGINKDRLKPFDYLSIGKLNSNDCKKCTVASGCKTCAGLCYDESHDGSLFQRTTYHCKMHKANVRAANYFWDKVSKKLSTDKSVERLIPKNKSPKIKRYLMIYTDDKAMPHCSYNNKKPECVAMPYDIFYKALSFSWNNDMIPVVIGNYQVDDFDINFIRISEKIKNNQGIVNANLTSTFREKVTGICNLHVKNSDLPSFYDNMLRFFENSSAERINIILDELDGFTDSDLKIYKEQLSILAKYLCDTNVTNNVSINVFEPQTDCDCGVSTFSVAPNGKFYICPGIYFYNPDLSIGNLKGTQSINDWGCLKKCVRCAYLNKKLTGEYEIDPDIVIKIKRIENVVKKEFDKMLFYKNETDRLEMLNI